jgi:hypothetical protein
MVKKSDNRYDNDDNNLMKSWRAGTRKILKSVSRCLFVKHKLKKNCPDIGPASGPYFPIHKRWMIGYANGKTRKTEVSKNIDLTA